MKSQRIFLIAGLVTAATMAFAQNQVVFAAAGSSAMFNQFETAAASTASVSITTNVYRRNGAGRCIDPSRTDNGDVWVLWQGDTPNDRKIWMYVSLDSTVGVRSYFNNNRLNLESPLGATNSGYAPMPADVEATIRNTTVTVNAGMTDITPADAKVTTARTFALGYSASNSLKGYSSTGGAGTVVPVNFNLANRTYKLASIGAAPVCVVVNKSDTAAFGLNNLSNISRSQLAYFLDGTFNRTSSLFADPDAATASRPVVTVLRETLSGTYVTTEYCIPNTSFAGTTQEAGIPVGSTAAPFNPLRTAKKTDGSIFDLAAPTNVGTGGRVRGIGTRGVLNIANQVPNSLGYTFWSVSQFTTLPSTQLWPNLKYITVDGIDPIQDNYAGGAFPTTASLTNLRNGSYPIWGILRVCAPAALIDNPGLFRATFESAASLFTGSDVVPKDQLLVFRSYRRTAEVANPSNGIIVPGTEDGADAGGMVFPINAERDFNADTNGQLINIRQ